MSNYNQEISNRVYVPIFDLYINLYEYVYFQSTFFTAYSKVKVASVLNCFTLIADSIA